DASTHLLFAVLDSRYRSNVCVYASQIAHENLCTYAPHAKWCIPPFPSATESVLIHLLRNVLPYLRFSPRIDQEFYDHMPLNGCGSFVLPLESLLFRPF